MAACYLPPKVPGAKPGLLGGPSLAAFDAEQDDGDDQAYLGGSTDLSDLPAPKRPSALAGAEGRSRDGTPYSDW